MTVRNRLDLAFEQAKEEERATLMPYLTVGFPDPDCFVDIALAVLDAGADALELGIPFSDPLLDGPTIQASQQAALDAGVTPVDCLRYAREIAERSDKPFLFMGAYNPVLAYGISQWCRDARDAGATGLIVPDLPREEQGDLQEATEAADLHLIGFVAPTSTEERIRRVCSVASGFIYCVSVTGVTGARQSVVESARPLVERLRRETDVPVAVGFGIAGPQQARDVAQFADGVIVGAALINTLAEGKDRPAEAAREFVASLREALG